MKVSREQAAQNRERILDTAAKLFREHGFDGIGVADLMKSAGLTHGGFYGHFSSKEDLMAQACTRSLEKAVTHWDRTIERASGNPLTAMTKGYLSTKHRDEPGQGCVFTTLGPDASRQGPEVRHALTTGVNSLVEVIARALPEKTKAAKHKRALATLASMVGAIVLARAVDDADLSDEILAAAAAAIAD